MSKLQFCLPAPASASEDLVVCLKAAGNDVVHLRDIIGNNDSGAVAAAFASLLAGGSSSAPDGSELRTKVSLSDCRRIQPV